jgi:hypothetical protein
MILSVRLVRLTKNKMVMYKDYNILSYVHLVSPTKALLDFGKNKKSWYEG